MSACDDVVRAVKDRLGAAQDDLHRAKAAWRQLGAGAMDEQYGESGKTRGEIISGYADTVARWEAALTSVTK